MSLKQDTTLVDFKEWFELLRVPLKEALDEMLIRAFKNGLQLDIQAELSKLIKIEIFYKIERGIG